MRRALVHLCLPMAAALIVGAVYNVVNAGFIGALHDTTLFAAITLGSPILGVVLGIGDVFGVGGSALSARLLGASDQDPGKRAEIKHVSSFAFWGSVLTGVVVGGLGLLLLHPLVLALGARASVVPAASAFFAVTLAFVPVLAAAICLEQLVRAEGASRQAMTGLIASTLASVVLDVLFILVLRWGVAGAALSTGLANVVSIVYFATWLTRRSEDASLSPRWFTLRAAVVRPVLGVGASALLQAGIVIVSALVINTLAAGYGQGPLAALGVGVRIAQVPEFLVMGVTLGVLPLLACAYGKGDSRRLRSALRASAITVGGIGILFSAIVLLFRDQVFAAFVADPAVLPIGVTVLAAQLVAMIANGFTGLITSLFQATGRAAAATGLSLAQALLFFPIVFAGNAVFGLPGVIWALTVTESAVCIVGVVLWLVSPPAIARGLAEGSEERADQALESVDG